MQGAEDKDVAARVEVLETILQHNRPVLRHIFYQKQHQAYKWFQMRLNYTRSVATNSIVGFILGIGDRHTSNLLFDTVQGEIVPIDFGVAFDSVRLSISNRGMETYLCDRARDCLFPSWCLSG